LKQLAAAIARIAGLNEQAAHDKALAAADQTWSDLLGIPPELAVSIDSATLVGMLRDPEKIRLAARLLHEQARAFAAQGDPARAQLRYRRAMELLLEARALDANEPTADAAAIEALRPLVRSRRWRRATRRSPQPGMLRRSASTEGDQSHDLAAPPALEDTTRALTSRDDDCACPPLDPRRPAR